MLKERVLVADIVKLERIASRLPPLNGHVM